MVKILFAYLEKNDELYRINKTKVQPLKRELMKPKFINEIGKMMLDSIRESIIEGEHAASIVHETESYTIDVTCHREGIVEVELISNEDGIKNLPNIASAIKDNLPDWGEVEDMVWSDDEEDEWQSHGFRNESDYNQWRHGS